MTWPRAPARLSLRRWGAGAAKLRCPPTVPRPLRHRPGLAGWVVSVAILKLLTATPVPCGRLGTPDSSGMRESGMKSGPCRRVAPGPSSRRQGAEPMGDCAENGRLCRSDTGVRSAPRPARLRPPDGARPATLLRTAERRARRLSAVEGHHRLTRRRIAQSAHGVLDCPRFGGRLTAFVVTGPGPDCVRS